MKLKTVVKAINKAARAKSPQILVAVGIGGYLTAMLLSNRQTPKAVKLMEEEKKRQGVDELKPVDVVKVTWKCYAPSVLIFGLSTACVIGGQHITTRRAAAFATAYSLSEATLKEYKDKVVETIGEKKEEEIRNEIAKDTIRDNPPTHGNVISTKHGHVICYDKISGRYFTGSIDKILRVCSDLNKEMHTSFDEYVSLNKYYDCVGLKRVDAGTDLGWNVNQEIIPDFEWVTGSDEYENEPILYVGFNVAPRYNYQDLS